MVRRRRARSDRGRRGQRCGVGDAAARRGRSPVSIRTGPREIETVKTGSSPAAIAVAGGSVWAAAGVPQAAHRGGTLRVLVPRPVDRGADGLVALGGRTPPGPPCQLSSLAYDGLVAYRRVEGAAGATIVGALATHAPGPSPDGRTYVFTLRPGVRYSDGRPVQPEDFRASIERVLQVDRGRDRFPRSSRGSPAPRSACTGRRRCDLSRRDRDRASGAHDHRPPDAAATRSSCTSSRCPSRTSCPRAAPAARRRRRTPPGTGPTASRVGRQAAAGCSSATALPRDAGAGRQGFADRIDIGVRREHDGRAADRRRRARRRRPRGHRPSVRQLRHAGSHAGA